jgi:CRISPR-associated endonuclease Csy4
MDHYLEIQILPEPDIPIHQLLAALYAKLHTALVQIESHRIAVAFPDYCSSPASLGHRLRLIGPEPELIELMARNWVHGLRDHAKIGEIRKVPAGATARALRRVQAKSSPERLRRRQMRRHGLTESEALERVPDSAAETLRLPFVQLTSRSTGQTFRLYLRLGTPEREARLGEFNAYGLSTTATIPCF